MNRKPIPLRTELAHAPVAPDLVQELGALSCDGECRYHQPRVDRHHTVFGSDLTEAEQLLRSHPDFILNMCRCLHEQIHRTWDRSEPLSDGFVVGYLTASEHNLSATKQKKLNQLRRGNGA